MTRPHWTLAAYMFTHTPEPSSMWQVPELSPLVLCPGNTRPFGLSRLSAPSPQLKDPAKLCPGASSWHHSLETHSHHTSPLACFQHHSLPDLFRLERGPGIALQAMQEKKALSSRRCARPSGVPRGPATSTGSLASQRHPEQARNPSLLSGVLGTGLPGLGTEHLPGALCSGTGSPALGLCSP